MKILVVGSWHPDKIKKYVPQAKELGYELAKRKHILVASPSTGIQGLVAQAYKENGGFNFMGYFPMIRFMEEVGEKVLIKPDVPIYTGEDYPVRNLIQIRRSNAVIGITGGRGTRSELEAAIYDYKLPTAFYSGSSDVVERFRTIDPYFKENLKYGTNIGELLDYLEK